MKNISDKSQLTKTPLFLGMSAGDIDDIVATASLGLHKYARGKLIAADGDACRHLRMLINGTVSIESRAYDNGYLVEETATAPYMMQLECLFGLIQLYTKTFTAESECHILVIDKTEMMRLAERYDIFRLNVINIICTATQKAQREAWRTRPKTIQAKIIRFIESHCARPAGRKVLRIKMTRLAAEIAESRLNVSRELHAMSAGGLIELHRNCITVPAIEKLICL